MMYVMLPMPCLFFGTGVEMDYAPIPAFGEVDDSG
jgi:hypothetical protein